LGHQDALCRNTSRPEELPRVEVPRVFLERTIDNVKRHVHAQAVELVFNLDEVGGSDWEILAKKV
jgi:hypothetical protein